MNARLDTRTIGLNYAQGNTSICIWAPEKRQVSVVLEEEGTSIVLTDDGRGFWKGHSALVKTGVLYKIKVDDVLYPDPSSLSQPHGLHSASCCIDLKCFDWEDQYWTNLDFSAYILYELHVGTFTPQGTFQAVIEKLDYLLDLGVNAVELMPVAQFPGERNWGYDGVFPFAVQHSYGGARGLQELVNACHKKGIAVVLDVVYNHLGPEGNYLSAFGPFFTDKYKTPWGKAVNLDDQYSDGVRQWIIENALMWFRDFHVDALRLDAVHALKDFGAVHLLEELSAYTGQLAAKTGKSFYLIGECDLNDVKYIKPHRENGYGLHAQWIDEFHHALRRAIGEPPKGYYADFKGVEDLAKAYEQAYVYNGTYSEHRKRTFGSRTDGRPGKQFVVFSQNHDQVGNRRLGERSGQLYGFEVQKLLVGAVMVAPYVPLLFMGEEYGETNPFLYFVGHSDQALLEAVRNGRKAEFKDFHDGEDTPDPILIETFTRSCLQWQLLHQGQHQHLFQYYKTLIHFRKTLAALKELDRTRVKVNKLQEEVLMVERAHHTQPLIAVLNFSATHVQVGWPFDPLAYQRLLDSSSAEWGGLGLEKEISSTSLLTLQPQSIHLYVLKSQ